MANQDKILWTLTEPSGSDQIKEQEITGTSTGFGPAPQLSPKNASESANSVAVGEGESKSPPASKFKIQTVL